MEFTNLDNNEINVEELSYLDLLRVFQLLGIKINKDL